MQIGLAANSVPKKKHFFLLLMPVRELTKVYPQVRSLDSCYQRLEDCASTTGSIPAPEGRSNCDDDRQWTGRFEWRGELREDLHCYESNRQSMDSLVSGRPMQSAKRLQLQYAEPHTCNGTMTLFMTFSEKVLISGVIPL